MRIVTSLVMVLLAAVVSPLAYNQVLTGSIVGQVVDASGAAVPDASIRITHRETNTSRGTVTNAAGEYSFPSLPGGLYDVAIQKAGFQSFTAQGKASR